MTPKASLPVLHWSKVQRARFLMAKGFSLHQTAERMGEDARVLDLSLWRNLGAR
jgi:hypothetical protein